MRKTERGFSLIEALVAMAIILIGASVAIIQLRSTMAVLDADKAINMVSSNLRYARQVAVDQRRNVFVEFVGGNQFKATRLDPDDAMTVVVDTTLPAGYVFSMPEDVVDTPDGYGNETAVYFNMNTSGTFQADGSFVDPNGLVANGSVFTMGGKVSSARALTVTGATGRTRIYWFDGTSWIERK